MGIWGPMVPPVGNLGAGDLGQLFGSLLLELEWAGGIDTWYSEQGIDADALNEWLDALAEKFSDPRAAVDMGFALGWLAHREHGDNLNEMGC